MLYDGELGVEPAFRPGHDILHAAAGNRGNQRDLVVLKRGMDQAFDMLRGIVRFGVDGLAVPLELLFFRKVHPFDRVELQDRLAGEIAAGEVGCIDERTGPSTAELTVQVDLSLNTPLLKHDRSQVGIGVGPGQAGWIAVGCSCHSVPRWKIFLRAGMLASDGAVART